MKTTLTLAATVLAVLTWLSVVAGEPIPPPAYLQFDGINNYVEIPSSTDFSVSATGLTVSAWMRPDTLEFPRTEGCGYVHWLGKGEPGEHEWVFRMYRLDAVGCPNARPNRISFYVFNLGPPPQRGCGSYFEDPIQPGEWVHVVGVIDGQSAIIHIYKNGALRFSQSFAGIIAPEPGGAPLRMGTRDFASLFQGAVARVRVWNRPLDPAEIGALHDSDSVPPEGLVAEYLLDDSRFVSGRYPAGHVSAAWGSDSSPMNTTMARSGGGC